MNKKRKSDTDTERTRVRKHCDRQYLGNDPKTHLRSNYKHCWYQWKEEKLRIETDFVKKNTHMEIIELKTQ